MNTENKPDRRFFEIYLGDELVAKFKILRTALDDIYAHNIEELLIKESKKEAKNYLVKTIRQIEFDAESEHDESYTYKFIYRYCEEAKKALNELIKNVLNSVHHFSNEFKEVFRYMIYMEENLYEHIK